MKNFLVETYYTCTFKTIHRLDELNEKSMSAIDSRDDGTVEVIEVKLNNKEKQKNWKKKIKDNKINEKVQVIEEKLEKK